LARYRRVPAATINDLRQASGNDDAVQPAVEDAEEVSYRDLQAQAKELGIAANQSREDLEAAIAEAEA
jgi:hypothetical protein